MQKLTLVYKDKVYEVEEGWHGLLFSEEGYVFEETKYQTYSLYAEPRELHYRGRGYVIKKHKDGLWRFEDGTIADVEEDQLKKDKETRFGLGYFALSKKHKLTDAARPHDHAYSSPAWQALQPRSETDSYLKSLVQKVYRNRFGRVLGSVSREVCQVFGGALWENESTRDK